MPQLWQGRASKAVDSRVNDFNSSIRFDARMIEQDIQGSLVHSAMLGRQGIISQQDVDDIHKGLHSILDDLHSGALEIDPNAEDVHTFVEQTLTARVGDAGKRLSGGEKQRIAIARAILKNAPIVILDEATAFTDPQNEDKIQKSIMALSKGKTLLVIAHRLSTIQNADQIVVLKKGQIVDCGKQGELLERCPLYADMWQAHIGAKSWSVGEQKEVAVNV